MPDYNPAVAAGIQVPQTNFASTLGTAANIQAEQARTGLYTLQGLQQERRFNALKQMGDYYNRTGDANGAAKVGISLGLEPEMATQMATFGATQRGISAAGGMLPSNTEQLAGAAANYARAANEKAQYPGFVAQSQQRGAEAVGATQKVQGEAANSLYMDPSPENVQRVGQTLGWNPLVAGTIAKKSPEEIRGIAMQFMAPNMTPEQMTNFAQPAQPATPGQSGQEAAPAQPATPARLRQPGEVKRIEEYTAQNTKDLTEANAQYRNANVAQFRLGDLRKNLNNLGGLLSPGAGFNERVALAKGLDAAGINIGFTKDQLAAAQASVKGSTYLGFDLAKTLGSREAAMIVQQSIGVQPGGQMTAEGNQRVWASLSVANQYNKDHATFVRQYLKQNPNAVPGDADAAFNQDHPVSSYISDVDKVVKIQRDKNKSGGYLVDDLSAGKGSAKEFDEHYGGNYSRYFGK